MIPPPDDQGKECPRCAEVIRAKAVVCRFCGHEMALGSAAQQSSPGYPVPPTHQADEVVPIISNPLRQVLRGSINGCALLLLAAAMVFVFLVARSCSTAFRG